MICEYYGKKCLYTPVALSLSCENCVVKMAYKNGVIKGRKNDRYQEGWNSGYQHAMDDQGLE